MRKQDYKDRKLKQGVQWWENGIKEMENRRVIERKIERKEREERERGK